VFFARRPPDDRIGEFIASQREQPFSYKTLDRGYNVDHNRTELGRSEEAFERAKTAIRQWKMFDMPWIRLCWPDAPVEAGTTVAVLVSHLGFWSVNAARILYTIDEPRRFGFAYGTLLDHAESGEERFSVELLDDGSVWYDLHAYSRPNLVARLGYPIARHLQKKFARESLAAMRRATL
jgi:uncharacterized protein (UPF0548 family)